MSSWTSILSHCAPPPFVRDYDCAEDIDEEVYEFYDIVDDDDPSVTLVVLI